MTVVLEWNVSLKLQHAGGGPRYSDKVLRGVGWSMCQPVLRSD